MSSTATAVDNLTLNIIQEVHVRAPLDVTFAALLEQLGPGADKPDGEPMPRSKHGPAAAGSAIWAMATVISGASCRPSSARLCSKLWDLFLCPIQWFRTSNTA